MKLRQATVSSIISKFREIENIITVRIIDKVINKSISYILRNACHLSKPPALRPRRAARVGITLALHTIGSAKLAFAVAAISAVKSTVFIVDCIFTNQIAL